MGTDPYSPGYVPDGQGTRPNLGDVGSGNQFGLDLYALYRAGRVHFPEQATRFSGLATDAQHAGGSITSVQSDAGNPPALQDILELRERLHHAIYKMTISLRDLGPVLVKLADDYAATDAEARDGFRSMIESTAEKGQYGSGPITVPEPPRPDEPPPPPPTSMSRPGGQQIPI